MPRSQSMNVLFVLLLCCPSSGPVILASVGLVAARVVILQDGVRPLLAEGAAKRAANRAAVHAGGDGAVPHAPGELVPQPHLKTNNLKQDRYANICGRAMVVRTTNASSGKAPGTAWNGKRHLCHDVGGALPLMMPAHTDTDAPGGTRFFFTAGFVNPSSTLAADAGARKGYGF